MAFQYLQLFGDYTTNVEDNSVKLHLYDLAQKKLEPLFTYSFDRFDEFYKGHYQNNIVMKDGKIYFDDVINDYTQIILYEYDIETAALTEIAKNALDPHICENLS